MLTSYNPNIRRQSTGGDNKTYVQLSVSHYTAVVFNLAPRNQTERSTIQTGPSDITGPTPQNVLGFCVCIACLMSTDILVDLTLGFTHEKF